MIIFLHSMELAFSLGLSLGHRFYQLRLFFKVFFLFKVNYSAYNAIGLPGYANPTAPVGLNCGVVNTGQSLFSVPHYAASGVGSASMTNSAANAAAQVHNFFNIIKHHFWS